MFRFAGAICLAAMSVRIAINGFGRVGRCVVRAAQGTDVEIVAINDITAPQTLAHLLQYDSIYGKCAAPVRSSDKSIFVGEHEIPVYAEPDPSTLPWRQLGADIVLECSGKFTNREGAEKHLAAGAKRVLISAPGKDADVTIAMGVNEDHFDPNRHRIVSNASCTTNCLAPVAKVLHQSFGIRRGWMTTTHAYTGDQVLLDRPHKDLRRARAAALSMIPTTTGAAKAVGLVLPELAGKLDGIAVRVPTAAVSLVDLSVELVAKTDAATINAALQDASRGSLRGILDVCDEPLVSQDFIANPHSAIVDAGSTKVLDGNFAKIFAWYDNEVGYSHRLIDLARWVTSNNR